MVHVGADLGRMKGAQQPLHHFFVVNHFPIPRQIEVVVQGIEYRNHRLASCLHREFAALKHVAGINQKAVLVQCPFCFEAGGQVSIASCFAKHHLPVFPKKLVVRMDLAVHVGGLKNDGLHLVGIQAYTT